MVERLGDRTHLHVRLSDGATLVAEDKGTSDAVPGAEARFRVDAETAHLFDGDGRAYHAS